MSMESLIFNYEQIKKVDVTPIVLTAFVPSPTDDDYRVGVITRAFAQKPGVKGYPIFEIDPKDIPLLSKSTKGGQPYKVVKLSWRISGPITDLYKSGVYYPSVITTNRKSVAEAAKTMPDIERYLVNLTQFHRP